MSDTIADGYTRVSWVATIANITAPALPELTAGTSIDLTPRMTPDGLNIEPKTALVDTGALASTFDTSELGRVSYDNPDLTFKRGTTPAEDRPYTTLVRGVHGYVVVRRNVPYTTAWASGQQVEVYPVACGERINAKSAKNEVMKWSLPLAVTTEPAPNAVIA
ncbi:hypothetical protein [Kitasatospora sp. CB02891]|uniref:phage tail tube protein n=1 Tax=Kitasatospora sp. CB02891 TaxID=2020329 RepID=UPI000C27765A|nr:hypothetical protein [Kitasatospora sp. CB02891]PJN24063.1 hypothetical protein CG736_19400 [Kitasatospora sp. CB02891]